MSVVLNEVKRHKPLKTAPPTLRSSSGNNTCQNLNEDKSLDPANDTCSSIHQLILEYFELQGLQQTYKTFIKECHALDLPFPQTIKFPKFSKQKGFSREDADKFLQSFESNDGETILKLWSKHSDELERKNKAGSISITELTVFLHIYVATIPYRMNQGSDHHTVRLEKEKALLQLREFHENNSEMFTKHSSCLTFFAFPFVSDPSENEAFQIVFTEKWRKDLHAKLLTVIQPFRERNEPSTSRLYQMYVAHDKANKMPLVAKSSVMCLNEEGFSTINGTGEPVLISEHESEENIHGLFVSTSRAPNCSSGDFMDHESEEYFEGEQTVVVPNENEHSIERFSAFTGFVPKSPIKSNNGSLTVLNDFSNNDFRSPPRTYCVTPEKSVLFSSRSPPSSITY